MGECHDVLQSNIVFNLNSISSAARLSSSPLYGYSLALPSEPDDDEAFTAPEESGAIIRYHIEQYNYTSPRTLIAREDNTREGSCGAVARSQAHKYQPPRYTMVVQILFSSKLGFPNGENVIKENEEKLSKVLDVYEERLSKSKY